MPNLNGFNRRAFTKHAAMLPWVFSAVGAPSRELEFASLLCFTRADTENLLGIVFHNLATTEEFGGLLEVSSLTKCLEGVFAQLDLNEMGSFSITCLSLVASATVMESCRELELALGRKVRFGETFTLSDLISKVEGNGKNVLIGRIGKPTRFHVNSGEALYLEHSFPLAALPFIQDIPIHYEVARREKEATRDFQSLLHPLTMRVQNRNILGRDGKASK